ncbi:MAG: tetratricopeptide repeat protein, partial [Chitinophagaceae bacterium]|nr:tetratricopeptide repeat protein [Chitinophagaceae bacterium]
YAYGYGWEFTTTSLSAISSIQTMEHSGAIRAFRAVIFRIPSENKCVILLSNCANQSGYNLFENVLRIFRGGSWDIPKQLLADTLYKIIRKGGVAELSKAYHNLKFADFPTYNFSTASLEFLGERLMVSQNYSAAVAVFLLAVDEDPSFAYGYLYLGRAYEKLGRVDIAIKAYKKAITVNKTSRAANEAVFQIRYLQSRKAVPKKHKQKP